MRAVLFDLDGTLIDTWRLYIGAYQAVLAPHFGRPVTVQDLLRLGAVSELRLLRRAVGEEALPAFHRAFVEHYERLHDRLCDGFYPGVAELLGGLRQAGWPLGLVTGKSGPAWEVTAARLALGPFAVVVTDEAVAQPKPHPQGLRLALQALRVAPGEALYVGDSLADLEAAQAAGMRAAGVLWCKAPGERDRYLAAARERGALACLEAPRDLLALLPARPGAAPGDDLTQ